MEQTEVITYAAQLDFHLQLPLDQSYQTDSLKSHGLLGYNCFWLTSPTRIEPYISVNSPSGPLLITTLLFCCWACLIEALHPQWKFHPTVKKHSRPPVESCTKEKKDLQPINRLSFEKRSISWKTRRHRAKPRKLTLQNMRVYSYCEVDNLSRLTPSVRIH